MASGGEVIRELFNVIGLRVDEASAAKAEAAMREWEERAKSIGETVSVAAGHLAEFINQTAGITKASRRITKAMDAAGLSAASAAKGFEVAAVKATNLREEVSGIGKETWSAAKKTSALGTGLQDLAKGVLDAKKAEAAAAKEVRQTTAARVQSTAATDEGIGTLGKFGLAMQGIREAVTLAGEAAHFLLGGLVATSKEMLSSSKVSGVSARFFQETAYAAQAVGFEANDLRDVFVDLSDKAANGGEDQQLAFKALGVQVKDANGKLRSMEEVVLELADGFAAMEDGTQKTAYASALLGEQGSRLLPVLSKGRKGLKQWADEARELGVVLDDSTLETTESFGKDLIRLQAAGTGLRNVLGAALIPALAKLAQGLLNVSKRITPLVRSGMAEWAERFTKAADFMTKGVDKLRTAVTLAAGALLGKYLLAVSTVTGAQLAWGSAALIAGARAAAGTALAVAPWLLLGGLIALVVDDLWGFATGSESALGNFEKWVNRIDPDDNNLVRLLKNAAALVLDVTDETKWGKFFDNFVLKEEEIKRIDEERAQANTEAWERVTRFFGILGDMLSRMWGGFSDWFETTGDERNAIESQRKEAMDRDLYERIGARRITQDAIAAGVATQNEKPGLLKRFFAGSYQTPEQAAIERYYAAGGGSRRWVQQLGLYEDSPTPRASPAPLSPGWAQSAGLGATLPSGPDAAAAYFGRGGSAATAVPSMAMGGQGGVFAPNTTIQMTVNAQPGQDAETVGTGAMSSAYDRAAEEKRKAYALFTAGLPATGG